MKESEGSLIEVQVKNLLCEGNDGDSVIRVIFLCKAVNKRVI